MSDTDPTVNFLHQPEGETREAARLAAYVAVFASPMARQVLTDILLCAGVGARKGPPTGVPGMRDYQAGREDCAADIWEAAGLSPADATAAVMAAEKGYYDRPNDDIGTNDDD